VINAMLIRYYTVEFLLCVCCAFIEKYSPNRKAGLRALFEHFQPTLLSYDEVNIIY